MIRINSSMSDYLDPDNKELLNDFFQEASGQSELLEQNILALEQNPGNRDAIDELFRAAHTLKGGAATVGMKKLAEVTHLLEDVLDEIRSGSAEVTEETVDCLLSAIDVIKAMLDAKVRGKEYKSDTKKLEKRLSGLLGAAPPAARSAGKQAPAAKHTPPKQAPAKGSAPADNRRLSEYEVLELKEAAEAHRHVFEVSVQFDEDNPMNTVGGIQVYVALKEAGTVLKTDPDFERLYQDHFYPVILYYLATDKDAAAIEKACLIPDVTLGVTVTPLEFDAESGRAALDTAAAATERGHGESAEEQHASETQTAGGEEHHRRKIVGSVLRVDSKRIDQLLNLVSEVVINKASFNQLSANLGNGYLEFQGLQDQYRERIRELFDTLPSYLEAVSYTHLTLPTKRIV